MWIVGLLLTYFSLTVGTLQQCEDALQEMAGGLSEPSSLYGQMVLYSGAYVNDLGRYDKCNKLSSAKYVIFELLRAPYILFALCGPEICQASDYYTIISDLSTAPAPLKPLSQAIFLSDSPINVADTIVHFPKKYEDNHYDTINGGAVTVIFLICLLVVISLVGTFLDVRERFGTVESQYVVDHTSDKKRFIAASFANLPQSSSSSISQYFQCFSLYSNFLSLLKTPLKDDQSHIRAIEGVRVLTLCWLILGHLADIRLLRGVLMNVQDLPDIIADWKTNAITTAGYSLDTLLWTTGFLATYTLLVDLKDLPTLRWGEIYLHKLWHLWPLVCFTLFLTWGLFPYLGQGPLWFSYTDFCSDCEGYWWANLLFINNFFKRNAYNSCYLVSYYISLEVQFFLITPLVVYAYRRWGAGFSWMCAAFLMGIGLIVSFEIANQYDLNAQEISIGNEDYDYYYYYRPYTRVPAYAMGLLCALIVYGYDHRQSEKPDQAAIFVGNVLKNPVCSCVSFVAGLGTVIFCVFIQYTALKQGGPKFTYWSTAQNQAFITFSRWLFTIGVSLMIVPTTLGSLRAMNRVLTLWIWAPLSRMTYSCYLVTYNLGLVMMLSQKMAWYFNFLTFLTNYLMYVFCSYLMGFVICMLVEIPVLSLEKFFSSTRHSLKS